MATQKTILVVDDDTIILDVIRRLLENAGYKVLTASDYREAIEIALNVHLDLMLLDIMMPGMDGTAVLQITRKNTFLKKSFPIVYCSAKQKRDVDMTGADGFIQKPFLNKEFIAYVKKKLNDV